jgi:uncharacterized membrane protein (UPF0127 family)
LKAVKINLIEKTSKELIAAEIIRANTLFDKLFGLITRRRLRDREGLLIENCNSIHTFWMRYSIDVVFLDKKNQVLAIYYGVKPFRATPFIKNAFFVLEFNSGAIEKTSLMPGDLISFES